MTCTVPAGHEESEKHDTCEFVASVPLQHAFNPLQNLDDCEPVSHNFFPNGKHLPFPHV